MKFILLAALALTSFSAFAEYVSGKGKIEATSGFYPSAKNSMGVNLTVTGNAARILFDEIDHKTDETGLNSGTQIRQSENVQCIKISKRDIECRILLNSDGTAAKLPRLQLNN